MADLDRRAFLARSSFLAAAAGAAAVVPGVLSAVASEAPEADAAAADTASADAADGASTAAADAASTLVAHVRDLSTGEVAIFNGTREIVVQNPALARSILGAAR